MKAVDYIEKDLRDAMARWQETADKATDANTRTYAEFRVAGYVERIAQITLAQRAGCSHGINSNCPHFS